MTPSAVYICDALHHGSRLVQGSQSPTSLSALVELIVRSHAHPTPQEKCSATLCHIRCQLQCDDERLRIISARKDEGFESDSEASSVGTNEESFCARQEVKVINDHVLRLEKLIRSESASRSALKKKNDESFSSCSNGSTLGSSSSVSSSGAESEEDSPDASPTHSKRADGSVESNCLSSTVSHRKSDHSIITNSSCITEESVLGESYLMSDILFCHVSPIRPSFLVFVVKTFGSGQVCAHVFECLTEVAARTLYNQYHCASNRYKLNRYRNSKRRLDVARKGHDQTKGTTFSRASEEFRSFRNRGNINGLDSMYHVADGDENEHHLLCYSENEDDEGANVNVIEVNDNNTFHFKTYGMLQRTDENGVTHIEIESAPCSLSIGNAPQPSKSRICDSDKIVESLDMLSSRQQNGNVQKKKVTLDNGQPLKTVRSRDHTNSEEDKRIRQRLPPKTVREKTAKDSQKLQQIHTALEKNKMHDTCVTSVTNESSLRKDPSGEDMCQCTVSKRFAEKTQSKESSRDRSQDLKEKLHRSKGPAPVPPPRRHPHNPSLLLIPTKSGQENRRSLYPKESHVMRGNKIFRGEFPVYSALMRSADVNNNPPHYSYYTATGWITPHEYHSSRSRENVVGAEVQRRSRSKSPARRPMAHRYIDAVSAFSISQKLKDISESMFQSKKSHLPPAFGAAAPGKKDLENHQRANGTSDNVRSSSPTEVRHRSVIKSKKRGQLSPTNRRVTFSAYATVQLMEA